MTAVMERVVQTASAPRATADAAALMELRLIVEKQGRMIETLDARREQLDEMISDAMPIVNAAMLAVIRQLDAASTQEWKERMHVVIDDLNDVRRAPAPGLLALIRRLQDSDVRRGLALAVAALAAAGRLARLERGASKNSNTQGA